MIKLTDLLATIFILIITAAKSADNQGLQSRIIGGYQVIYYEYHYFALIDVTSVEGKKRYRSNCGGTLVAKNVVMTAAHCLKGRIENIRVQLNVIDKEKAQNSEVLYAKGWELHKDYLRLDNSVYHDIGLIYLEDGPRSVLPVKLNFDDLLDPGDNVAVIGFGTKGGDDLSDTLQVVYIDVSSNDYCSDTFEIELNIDLHFCTGILNEGKAACQGDSGGPAITRKDGSDIQVGIISAGASECRKSLTLYTRVSAYEDWLKDRVCNQNFAPDWCRDEAESGDEALSDLFASLTGETHNEAENIEFVAGCFAGSSVVEVKGAGRIQMRDLDIGDMVHVGNNVYEPVYSFGHRAQDARVSMIQIRTKTSVLRLTADHLVFTYPDGPLPASQVRIGDQVLDGDSKLDEVIALQNVTDYGLFNPFTPCGKIVVNNILSSNYIAFSNKNAFHLGRFKVNYHWLAHAAVAPLRTACHHMGKCRDETYSADGILLSLTMPLRCIQWLFAQSGMKHVVSVCFIFSIVTWQYAVEGLIFNPSVAIVFLSGVLCCVVSFWWLKSFVSSISLGWACKRYDYYRTPTHNKSSYDNQKTMNEEIIYTGSAKERIRSFALSN